MGRELRITVDKARCVSNLWCVRTLPGVFQVDEDGHAEAHDSTAASEDEIVEAAFGCPVEAISVVDALTREDLLS